MDFPWEKNWGEEAAPPPPKQEAKKPWLVDWVEKAFSNTPQKPQKQPTEASKPLGDGLTLDSVFEGLKQAESKGLHIDPKTGGLLTSQAGAEGITQLMPKTAAKPGYGIEGVKDKSEKEYLRVGKEYLAAMHKKYGDWEMALAAYNAGVGNVDKAKGKAERFGGEWKDYLPKKEETVPYIDRVLGRNPKGLIKATKDKMSQGLTGEQALENAKATGKDILSMLPVTGETMSAMDFHKAIKENNLPDAALAAMGMIPGVGMIGKASKMGTSAATLKKAESVGIGERFFKVKYDPKNKYASVLNNPITLKDGTRLSGFTDGAQTTFHGYDKNGERFTRKVSSLDPEDIVSSKDSNKTAEHIKSLLQKE